MRRRRLPGRPARREAPRLPGWLPRHVRLVAGSDVSLVTALLVVSWGSLLAWVLPTVLGTALVERAATRAAAARRWRRPSAGSLAAVPGGILHGMARRSSPAWRNRAAACSVATTIAVGLREALGEATPPAPVVVEHDGEPAEVERLTLFFHPEIPEATLVLLR